MNDKEQENSDLLAFENLIRRIPARLGDILGDAVNGTEFLNCSGTMDDGSPCNFRIPIRGWVTTRIFCPKCGAFYERDQRKRGGK